MENEDLSIILPVHNERDTLELVLNEWKKVLDHYQINYHFIICEDGSTDGTKELLKRIQGKYRLILQQKDKRCGYGLAVIGGLKAAITEYILCVDSDGQCDPLDFIKFWNSRYEAEVIMGHRLRRVDPVERKLFSLLFKAALRVLFPNKIHDPSAPFVLFSKKTIEPFYRYLTYLREGFWWGFVAMCIKKNISLKEIGINHRKRIKGKTQVYLLKEIPSIAVRNLAGLIKLRYVN